ncbi:MAG: TRAP transporter substrate-binding protein DctP [Peptococcaceae bacterium]|nr:TRAP transporter substrate-binding protein DctP [Peptococcaceae bacterium]
MKKLLVLLTSACVLVLISSMFVAGCSSKTGNQPSTPDTAKVYELKFSSWNPEGGLLAKVETEGMKRIEENSKGRIKITPYYSGTLLKNVDTYKGVATGVADIGYYTVGVTPGVQELNYIFNLPMPGLPDVVKTTNVYRELLKKFPELQQENEKNGVRWLSLTAMPHTYVHTTKKQIKVPADLKGKVIIAEGEQLCSVVTSNGGSAMSGVGGGDWYNTLQKGVADGILTHYVAINTFKTHEVFKYHTEMGEGGLGSIAMGYLINLKTWNSLPADLQQIIVEGFDWAGMERAKQYLVEEGQYKELEKGMGQIIYKTTPEETALWEKTLEPINEKWISGVEAKGLPARKVYNGLQELLK